MVGDTHHQSPLVLGLAPLETHDHVLVDQVLEEGPRVDRDETHIVVEGVGFRSLSLGIVDCRLRQGKAGG